MKDFIYSDFGYESFDNNTFRFCYFFEKEGYLQSVESPVFKFNESLETIEHMCGSKLAELAVKHIDWSTKKIIYKLLVNINGFDYNFDKSLDNNDIEGSKLSLIDNEDETKAPNVICPICWNDSFTIEYGRYCVNAKCSCGNLMQIYSG